MKKKIIKDIILTPIVDVVLIILLFFMIAYSRTSPNFSVQKIQLPSAKNMKPFKNNEKIAEISIDRNGRISINNTILDKNLIKKKILKLKREGITKFIIKADKNTVYEKVIEIMDILKESKIQRIFLAIKPKKGYKSAQ